MRFLTPEGVRNDKAKMEKTEGAAAPRPLSLFKNCCHSERSEEPHKAQVSVLLLRKR